MSEPSPEAGFAVVQDHGGVKKQEVTGAVREVALGKGRFDLIPPYPHKRLAIHYENGTKKYADRNWEKGLPLHRYLDSAERHMADFKAGDRTEDHLTAVIWNLYCYLHTEKELVEGRLPKELYTVPWSPSIPGWKNPT